LRQFPNAQLLTEWQKPSALIELTRNAAVVVGVSTALTHLAALTGTPALVVEHPTTAPAMYRAPVPFVRYIRPANPWWCDNPSNDDVERAIAEPENTYGFAPSEWRDAVDQIILQPPFAGNN
jgi:ADP-heptose:LPS heptosyltransferase